LMDRPSAHRDASAKEHQALASIQDTASAKAPAATAAPAPPPQNVSQSSACSDKAWPPCLPASTENHASSQSEAPAASSSVPYLAGSISTASYPAESGTGRPVASNSAPTAPAPVVTEQAATPNQNRIVAGTSGGGDVAPAMHEQIREFQPAASDWRSRRAERRAEREQRRAERHQYRYSRRAEPPAPQAPQAVPAQTAEPQTDANSRAGETSSGPSATEQRAADNTERVSSSQRHRRKARSGTQQRDAASQEPPREPDYAERRDNGFGFFFGR
jgi:hypothetical protein